MKSDKAVAAKREELEANGYTVRFEHVFGVVPIAAGVRPERLPLSIKVRSGRRLPIRMVTICAIWTSDDEAAAEGRAYCSLQDQWDRRLGNRIAFGRAVLDLEGGRR
jgi:hypothetical protein